MATSKRQDNKGWERWEKPENSNIAAGISCEEAEATVEDRRQDLKTEVTQAKLFFPEAYAWEPKPSVHTGNTGLYTLLVNFHSSSIRKSQKVYTTQISINWQILEE